MSTLAEFESDPDHIGDNTWKWCSTTIMDLTKVARASPALMGGTSVWMTGDGQHLYIRAQYEEFKAMWRKAMGLT